MGESIKEECLKYFITKETFYALLKYLIPVLAFFMTGACAFAINELKDRSEIKGTISAIQRKQDFMGDTVIAKLSQQGQIYGRLETKLDSLLKK